MDLAILSEKQFVAEKEATVIISNSGFQCITEIPQSKDKIWNELCIPRRFLISSSVKF